MTCIFTRIKRKSDLFTENLDELERFVVPLFEKIDNKNAKKQIYPFKFHPLGAEQLQKEIYIAPQSDRQSLRVIFPVPDTTHQYKTNVSSGIVLLQNNNLSVESF